MAFKKVSDLNAYLNKSGISPERIAKTVGISNMTLRRLLEKAPKSAIPNRYRLALDFHLLKSQKSPFNFKKGEFDPFMEDLVGDGEQVKNSKTVTNNVKKKLAQNPLKILQSHIVELLSTLKNPNINQRNRALILGALVYFLNPFDVIPDAMVGIGYLDDFAVISLVLGLCKK